MKILSVGNSQTAFSAVHLLIVLSLALCGMVVWQWSKEKRLLEDTQALQKITNSLTLKRDDFAKRLLDMQADSASIQDVRARLEAEVKTNVTLIRSFSNEVVRYRREMTTHSNRAEVFADAFRRATNQMVGVQEKIDAVAEKARKASESINKLNAITAERNQFLGELNTRTDEYNKLTIKHDELIKELNKYRSGEKK